MEEAEGLGSGSASAEATNASDTGPVAVALALGGASREKADAFLDDHRAFLRTQTALIDLQKHHLREQFKQLNEQIVQGRLRIWELRMGILLRLATAVVGIGIACVIAIAVWNAAHADGLVIESFAVPPDMASRGFTGQVIAAKTLDELTAMQNATITNRAPRSYANNWGDNIRVEIPETGISVGEAYRFLKGWLGHETHISGEVTRTASGVAITARVSGGSGITASGSETELDALVRKAAEHIYGSTQPYRYASYLNGQGRTQEAIPIYKALSEGAAQERPWGYIGLAISTANAASDARVSLLERALSLQPDNVLIHQILITAKGFQGRDEEVLGLDNRVQEIFRRGSGADLINPAQMPGLLKASDARMAMATGDFRKAARDLADGIALGARNPQPSPSSAKALAETGAHDLAAARATMADPIRSGNNPGINKLTDSATRMRMDSEAGDWAAVLSRARALDPLAEKDPYVRGGLRTISTPLAAYAQARVGDFAAAEKMIAPTPFTCYPCLRMRARIAEAHGQHARADWWFARALAAGPSFPFADAEWGAALLERGQPDQAIEKFKAAIGKGPHFADPLEGWGEALMAKNQSHRALAKFEEADKYAPNWGRLHLKWGEALVYAGKRDEAQKQFARAAALDLTPSEKAELTEKDHV